MSEEKEEAVEETKEVHVTEEDFVNTLSAVRSKQKSAEQEELQVLAQRLSVLQQRLEQAKVKIQREKAQHEILLVKETMGTVLNLFSVSDLEVNAKAKELSMKCLDILEQVLDREFPSGE